MRIILTEEDISLVKKRKNSFEYRMNKTKVEGFKTAKEAINHAEERMTEFIKDKYFKNA